MKVFGHDKVRKILESPDAPNVVLLLGPRSVGKSTVAEAHVQSAGYVAADVLRVRKLTADAAREVARFVGRRAMGPKGKIVLANLDGATPAALNALLKTLEEPPPGARFMLLASQTPLLTILSRCHVFHFGFLSRREVRDILISKYGMMPDVADKAASASGGQVSRALEFTELDQLKNPVLSLMRACQSHDHDLFMNVASSWDGKAHEMLLAWFHECLVNQRRIFTDAEFFGFTRNSPGIVKAYRALQSAPRPRIAVKNSLWDIVAAQ